MRMCYGIHILFLLPYPHKAFLPSANEVWGKVMFSEVFVCVVKGGRAWQYDEIPRKRPPPDRDPPGTETPRDKDPSRKRRPLDRGPPGQSRPLLDRELPDRGPLTVQ